MTLPGELNELVRAPFTVFDTDGETPVSGLTDGDFTKVLRVNGTATAVLVTIVEVGGGDYTADFTPNALGTWYLRVETPFGVWLGCTVQVSEDDLGDSITTIRKIATNAQEVDVVADELIVRDDDGVSVFQSWDLFTTGGESVSTQPGVQTRRGPPKN